MHVLLLWLSSILLYEVHVTKMVSLLIGMRFLHTSLFNLNLFFTENVTSLIFRYAVPSSYITNKTERRDETDTAAVCLASTLNYYDAQLSSR